MRLLWEFIVIVFTHQSKSSDTGQACSTHIQAPGEPGAGRKPMEPD